MERFDIKYLGTILTIVNVDDYNIRGTFDPQAESDVEFFGYRETTYDIVAGFTDYNGLPVPLDEEQLDYYRKNMESCVTLVVQDYLDEL